MVWGGKHFKDHLVPTPLPQTPYHPLDQVAQAPSRPAWNTSQDGAFKTPLENLLLQCLTTLTVKNVFLSFLPYIWGLYLYSLFQRIHPKVRSLLFAMVVSWDVDRIPPLDTNLFYWVQIYQASTIFQFCQLIHIECAIHKE